MPTVNPTPTLAPAPTATAASVGEWCVFRAKYDEFLKAEKAFNDMWTIRAKQDPLSSDEWQTWATGYVDIYQLACSLPRGPLAARLIADKLCACAESLMGWYRGAGSSDDLRIQANQGRTEAYDMVTDLDTQFGNPQCQ